MIKLNNQGFSIAELTIAIVVAVIVSIMLTMITIVFYGSILRGQIESELAVESQIIFRNIVDELRLASEVRETNLIVDANSPSGGWNTDTSLAILIIAIPAVDNSRQFIIDDTTGLPYQNEIVYFASDGSMFKRFLANPDATGNKLTTTCPAILADTNCPEDAELSQDYEAMNFIFYDQDDKVTVDTTLARSIEMNIDLSRNIFGGDASAKNNIRVTLRN
jgi:hypothetical protein